MQRIYFIILAFLIISCNDEKSIKNQSEHNNSLSLVINIGQEPYSMDPSFNVTSGSLIYFNHIFECLVNKGEDGKIIPGAAKNWNISSNGLVYTFYLRDNAYWSDGKPIIAEDFVYSFRRLFNPKTKSKYAYQYDFIKNAKNIRNGEIAVKYLSVDAIDDHTLEIVLEYPVTYFLEILSFPTFAPLREDIIKVYPDTWTYSPKTFIGNGPFKVTDRKKDEYIIMEKNEYYWNSKEVIPNRLEFILKNDGEYSVNAVKNGSLHFSRNFPLEDITSLQKEGYIHSTPRAATYFYFVNNTNFTLSDVNVRKALSLAIDRNYIVSNITKGGELPASALVPYGITEFFGDFRKNSDNYFDINPKHYQNNIKEAKKLMMLAGYPNGNGFPILHFKTTYGIHENIFNAVQKMWKEHLGINAVIEKLEWSDLAEQRFNKQFDIASGGWNGDFNDPVNFLSIFLSYSPNNSSLYSNIRYDDLIKTTALITDTPHRMMTMHKAEELLIDDMPIIPIYFYNEHSLVSPKLKGIQYDSMGKHSFSKAYLED